MGKLRVFLIDLDNNKEVYFPGEEVIGEVVFELYSTLKIKEIILTFSGEANDTWHEIRRENEYKNFDFQSNKEKYFEEKLTLFQGNTDTGNDTNTEFTAQRHSFPFKFVLPNDIPSSFEANQGSKGHVRYTLNVSIDKTWDSGYNCRRAITVIYPMDLNKYEDVTIQTEEKKSKRLCCLCCRSGPVTGIIRLNKTGYVPGETIPAEIDIRNMSRSLCYVTVLLEMVATYFSTAKTKCDTYHPVIGKEISVQPGDNDSWTEKILIPALPPSNLEHCKIIDIYYQLELKIEPYGFSFPFSAFQTITIGTIPLRSDVQRTLTATKAETDPHPLQFKESTFGEVRIKESNDNDNTHGELMYTALYPWFDWLNQ